MPDSITAEELKSQVESGNGIGLWYLTEGIKASQNVFGKTQEFYDPRSKEVRDAKTSERIAEHGAKAAISHSYWLKRKASSGGQGS